MTNRLKILLFILSITLTSTMSCSTFLAYMEYKPGIDKELEYYVNYVKQLSPDFLEVDSVTFYYKTPSRSKDTYNIGFCSFNSTNWTNFVKINRHWWNTASDRERIILIAHELKHCSCPSNWTHINKEDYSECRTNYMSSSIPIKYCIAIYYNDYIQQIRRGCNDK